MFKKAQAAVEFLMTYGWAIVVVLAAIGALSYFGILDVASLLPERCNFPTGFDCVGRASIDASADTVRFIIQNDYGSRIIITSGTIDSNGDCSGTVSFCNGTGCTSFSTNPLTLPNNQRATVRLNCTNGIDEGRFRTDVTVNYNDTLTNFNFKATGQIRGRAI
ncbi:MAG: hypothetical protein ISS25_04325 [Nanoarchaeota archaeon]|nr:hypothetical protein [DPANN group archaeon]MBL7117027.1 hypothetical protein [Nanoarchaeota archaeon]